MQYRFAVNFGTLGILDARSETGGHGWNHLGYLIFLRHFIRSRAVTNLIIEDLKRFTSCKIVFFIKTVYLEDLNDKPRKW